MVNLTDLVADQTMIQANSGYESLTDPKIYLETNRIIVIFQ